MLDLVYLLMTAAFFGLCALYVRGLRHLQPEEGDE